MRIKRKRLIAVILAAAFLLSIIICIAGSARADEPDTNYLYYLEAAAVNGDAETGQAIEAARNAKIDRSGLTYSKINWEDLYYLSKIIYAEAGSDWLSDEWKMAVGEVVLNRVTNPDFPDTIKDVIFQPGQYYGSGSAHFRNLRPSWRCVELAVRLLEGERVLNNPKVVFQSNTPQGSGIYRAYHDKYLGWTYFCYQ